MIGDKVGHYVILEKLGSGGMGEVWLAEDSRLDRKVALKFLPGFAAQDEAEKARFIQEAKAAASLSHANIAQVYEIDEEDGRLYIVMEYVAGGSLRDQLDEARGKSLSLDRVLEWIRQTADGLAEAHRQGIVHRDIKPDNLMLTDTGQIKITDFGLARLETATRLTASGTTLGTVNYMSPELITGKDVDHRSDLFSLGVTCYELLTGQIAFSGTDANAIYYAILNNPIDPLTRYRKDLPEGLERITDKLLERNVSLRYQSAAEVATDIRRLLGYPTTATSLAIWNRTLKRAINRVPSGIWFGSVLILGIIVGLMVSSSDPDPIDLSDYSFTPLAVETEPEMTGIWSPDGSKVAFQRQSHDDRWWRLMFRDLKADTPVPLTRLPNLEPARTIFWSQDSDSLFYVGWGSPGQLYAIGTQPGMSPAQLPGIEITVADINHQLGIIAAWRGNKLTIRNLDGSVREEYHNIPAEIDSGKTPTYLRFSPDGTKIALAYYRRPTPESESPSSPGSDRGTSENISAGKSNFGFWVFPWPQSPSVEPYEAFNLGGKALNTLPSFDWMEDSKHVVLSLNGGLWIGNTETSQLNQILSSRTHAYSPNVSPDNTKILYCERRIDFNVVKIPFNGSLPIEIVGTSESESSPSYAQETGLLAYRRGRDEIWLEYPAGNRDIINLFDHLPPEEMPATVYEPAILSPNGEFLAFKIIGRESGLSVWTLSVIGLGAAMRAFPDSLGVHGGFGFGWSPDSEFLVATYSANELAIVRRGDPGTCESIVDNEVTPGWVFSPSWSPDGNWIACFVSQSPDKQILLVSPHDKSRKWIRNPSAGWDWKNLVMSWSQDGSLLYIANTMFGPAPPNGQYRGLWEVDIESNTSRRIMDLDRTIEFDCHTSFGIFGSITPDGSGFVTTARSYTSDLIIFEGFRPPN